MASDISAPARFAVAVTPSDSTVLTPTRALFIGVAGNLTVRMADQQNTVLLSNVPVGIFPIQCDQVRSTGTAATNIVALW
jgi:hypothetical protein